MEITVIFYLHFISLFTYSRRPTQIGKALDRPISTISPRPESPEQLNYEGKISLLKQYAKVDDLQIK